MKRYLTAATMGGLALALAALMFAAQAALAAGGATKTASTAAPAPIGTPGDLQSQLGPQVYDRIIRPIESKLAEAAMARDIIRLENEKPADKRNPALIISMKEREAGFYIGASLAAVEGAAQMTTPPLKNAVIELFEKPNRVKAIVILNEVAATAAAEKDYSRAAALYKRILALDPDNQPAKDALIIVNNAAKNAPKPTATGSTGTLR